MDLTYPPEAEQFRKEIRPGSRRTSPRAGSTTGFELTRRGAQGASTRSGRSKLYEGGWICASWPQEYGGKGLHDGERRAERGVRPGQARRCGPTSSATRSSAPPSCSGAPRSRRRSSCPRSCSGEISLVPGLQRAGLRLRPRLAQDHGRARRRRVGDQRPEGLDHPGAVRRLHLPAGPHRPGRAQAHGHLVPARADEAARHRGAADRRSPTASAEFNEVFFDNARCPKDNVVGRRQQRLERGHDHARLRAGHVGHHRLPPLLRRARRRSSTQARKQRQASTIRSSARAWRTAVEGADHGGQRPAVAHRDAQREEGPAAAALGATNKMFWSEIPPRRDGARPRHHRAGRPDPHRRRRPGVRARRWAARARAAALPGEPAAGVVLLLPLGDDLGRHGRDPAQHRGRARARPAQGAEAPACTS